MTDRKRNEKQSEDRVSDKTLHENGNRTNNRLPALESKKQRLMKDVRRQDARDSNLRV